MYTVRPAGGGKVVKKKRARPFAGEDELAIAPVPYRNLGGRRFGPRPSESMPSRTGFTEMPARGIEGEAMRDARRETVQNTIEFNANNRARQLQSLRDQVRREQGAFISQEREAMQLEEVETQSGFGVGSIVDFLREGGVRSMSPDDRLRFFGTDSPSTSDIRSAFSNMGTTARRRAEGARMIVGTGQSEEFVRRQQALSERHHEMTTRSRRHTTRVSPPRPSLFDGIDMPSDEFISMSREERERDYTPRERTIAESGRAFLDNTDDEFVDRQIAHLNPY